MSIASRAASLLVIGQQLRIQATDHPLHRVLRVNGIVNQQPQFVPFPDSSGHPTKSSLVIPARVMINAWMGRPISLVPISMRHALFWPTASSSKTGVSPQVGVRLSSATMSGRMLGVAGRSSHQPTEAWCTRRRAEGGELRACSGFYSSEIRTLAYDSFHTVIQWHSGARQGPAR